MADLLEQGIVTKVRTLKTGKRVGGIPFTRGPLAYLLRNRFYIGEAAFKGEALKGEQPPIIDRALFDAVQAKLNEQATSSKTSRMQSEAVLASRISDDRCSRSSSRSAFLGRPCELAIAVFVRETPIFLREGACRYGGTAPGTSG